jgi:hypothetical protein
MIITKQVRSLADVRYGTDQTNEISINDNDDIVFLLLLLCFTRIVSFRLLWS